MCALDISGLPQFMDMPVETDQGLVFLRSFLPQPGCQRGFYYQRPVPGFSSSFGARSRAYPYGGAWKLKIALDLSFTRSRSILRALVPTLHRVFGVAYSREWDLPMKIVIISCSPTGTFLLLQLTMTAESSITLSTSKWSSFPGAIYTL